MTKIKVFCYVQVCTSSTVLITSRDEQVDKHRRVDEMLRTAIRNTQKMVFCFKKLSVINDSNGTDTLALVPSTLMQVMTLERSVSYLFISLTTTVHLAVFIFCCFPLAWQVE